MPMHKGGKGGTRKHGRGKEKASHSKFGSYAGIIGASDVRKLQRIESRKKRLRALREQRFCDKCGRKGFSDRRTMRRHMLRCTGEVTP